MRVSKGLKTLEMKLECRKQGCYQLKEKQRSNQDDKQLEKSEKHHDALSDEGGTREKTEKKVIDLAPPIRGIVMFIKEH